MSATTPPTDRRCRCWHATGRRRPTYCVEVTIKAVDGDGLTLAEAVAEPRTGESRLEPGDSVNLAAQLTGIDINDVDDYLAFVTDEQAC